jgi:hypothetical protein
VVGGKDMEPLTKEKLEEVKKFAESLGFECYVHDGTETAFYRSPDRYVEVFYNQRIIFKPDGAKIGYEIVINWGSKSVGIEETKQFLQQMGYAVQIAEKLKEA